MRRGPAAPLLYGEQALCCYILGLRFVLISHFPLWMTLILGLENCSLPTNSAAGRVVRRIADLAHEYGDVVSFKAYNGFQMPEKHRPDLHCSGVSMIDCPHNGYKEVVDNTLIG
jgi:hypothetical protein